MNIEQLDIINDLHFITGFSRIDCKKVLIKTDWDVEIAKNLLCNKMKKCPQCSKPCKNLSHGRMLDATRYECIKCGYLFTEFRRMK